jgi:hypothetical protein
MMRLFARWFCALRGHHAVLGFEGTRMLMRCRACGYDSPGWNTR